MSTSIGRVFGIGSSSPYGYETDYMQYLRGYNPYNYEQTLQNMVPSAVNVERTAGLSAERANYRYAIRRRENNGYVQRKTGRSRCKTKAYAKQDYRQRKPNECI